MLLTGLALAGSAQEFAIKWQTGVPFVAADSRAGHWLVLESSEDLVFWQERARVRHELPPYGDWLAAGQPLRFYRLGFAPLQTTHDWSNQLNPERDELFTTPTGSGLAAIRSAKFTIRLAQPDRVYFQDTAKWPYHYHFAVARLPGCAGWSVLEYNEQSLYAGSNQQMVVGAVLRAPDPRVREMGIELTGAEAFPLARQIEWTEWVKRRLVLPEGWRVFYLPSLEQQAAAEAGREQFAARGLPLDTLARWVSGNTCYSPGWALGRLVYVPGTEISAALADGRLGLGDILVTDRVPAELPVLAGYLAFEPATPNSHVALLARSLLLPFAHAQGAGWQAEIASLTNREVLLVVEETTNGCHITLTDTTGLLTPERRREILASKQSGPLDLTPKTASGVISVATDSLTPDDLARVGGKAAHFGLLRSSIPAHSPTPAIAFTFDLWDEYLSQTLPGGQTLQQFITAQLAGFVYPPNLAALRTNLATVRETVQKIADFNAAQRMSIISALQQSGLQGRKIRFRSSTNVEDSENFSGAGLYDSYSGCLADDLDGDKNGPSQCDPNEPEERGVFRAMRKVYASFYNENAYLERLRLGVDESKVGMALLAHFSSPDPDEMANGVATVAIEKTNGERQARIRLVTQLGAESVTNPDVSKRPEMVTLSATGTNLLNATMVLAETSSLTTGGAAVMTWENDYRELAGLLNAATLAYEAFYPDKTSFELDFEFKRLQPGVLSVKQMRAVPRPAPVPPPIIP